MIAAAVDLQVAVVLQGYLIPCSRAGVHTHTHKLHTHLCADVLHTTGVYLWAMRYMHIACQLHSTIPRQIYTINMYMCTCSVCYISNEHYDFSYPKHLSPTTERTSFKVTIITGFGIRSHVQP